jgi:flavin-dependent dehydrogenase
VRGAPVPAAGPSRPTWGERFLLVGDAGGFVSPASGEGLALALASVEAAASALKLCFATTSFGARRLRHYERLWRASMPDFAALSRLREALSGEQGLRWLEACPTDLERLALLAPLVGSADLGAGAEQVLARLRHGTAGAAPEGR